MFEKYKIAKYIVLGATEREWGIDKRFLLFWHRPMTFMKHVLDEHGNSCPGSPSYEILTFRTKERVRDEIDRLNFGEASLISRTYQNGILIGEKWERGR